MARTTEKAQRANPIVVQLDERGDVAREVRLLAFTREMKIYLETNLGVKKGDVVSYTFVNSIENLGLFISLVCIGATACPLNPKYTSVEVARYLKDLLPTHVLAHTLKPGDDKTAVHIAKTLVDAVDMLSSQHGHVSKLQDLSSFQPNLSDDDCPELLSILDQFLEASGTDLDAPVLLLHTGGTTGAPKVVPISKHSMVCSLQAIRQSYAFVSRDIGFAVMPFFHVHGLMCALSSMMIGGAKLVLPHSGQFSGSRFYRDVTRHEVTWYTAVPSIHEILARQDFDRGSWPTLRFIRSCSSALSPDLLERMKARFPGIPIVQAYGMTEACHQISTQSISREASAGSVGWANNDLEVKILGEHWCPVATGLEGRICLRGAQVTKGYANNPDANRTSFSDAGFFDTGDLGIQLSSGEIVISGRMKEMVNCGGEKINPAEVEAAIKEVSPSVKMAVVFPGDDAVLGEVVHAAVIWEGDEDDAIVEQKVIDELRKTVSPFKVPRKVHRTEHIRLSAVGKLQRMLVKEQFEGNSAN